MLNNSFIKAIDGLFKDDQILTPDIVSFHDIASSVDDGYAETS